MMHEETDQQIVSNKMEEKLNLALMRIVESWKAHPMSKLFFSILELKRQSAISELLAGKILPDNLERIRGVVDTIVSLQQIDIWLYSYAIEDKDFRKLLTEEMLHGK
jgi:hypothetical protein